MQSSNRVLTGEELRRVRRACGLTCEDVGKLMFTTRQHVAYLENPKNKPSKHALYYYTLILRDIWSKIPDSEKSLRLFVADAGAIYGSANGKEIVDIFKNGKCYIQYKEGDYEIF